MEKSKERPRLEAALESSEVVIDALMNDEVLSNIPLIGTAIKICKAVDDIRNRTFAAKVARFVSTFSQAGETLKDGWRKRVSGSPEEAQRIGETLFFVLERYTDLVKPLLLSQLFLAYIDNVISAEELRRLALAIDGCFPDDLEKLLALHDLPERSVEPWLRYLTPTGLVQVVGGQTFDDAGDIYYEVSPLGKTLRNAYFHGKRYTNDRQRNK